MLLRSPSSPPQQSWQFTHVHANAHLPSRERSVGTSQARRQADHFWNANGLDPRIHGARNGLCDAWIAVAPCRHQGRHGSLERDAVAREGGAEGKALSGTGARWGEDRRGREGGRKNA